MMGARMMFTSFQRECVFRKRAAVKVFLGTHWITSVARMRMDGGNVRPRALAVFVFTTSAKRVGCSTGRSAGLAPFGMLVM